MLGFLGLRSQMEESVPLQFHLVCVCVCPYTGLSAYFVLIDRNGVIVVIYKYWDAEFENKIGC